MRTNLLAFIVMSVSLFVANGATADKPNIVVILTDDQGYADISLNPHHPKEVSTPHMDALAKDGVVFSQGYTSGHVCSPTRAGLMLGQYQQRVGVYSAGDGGRGFNPELPIFPSFLPDEYASTAIGKWHAMTRGFDECYKFMGRGGHSYFDLRSDSEGKFAHPIYRNKDRINDEGYLTDRLSEEAVAFIDRNKQRPFFLYLAYNAVHAPPEAPQTTIDEYRKRFPAISNERVILMAMLKHLDDGVGAVVGKLKKEDLFDNTLLFFLTDNGGSKAMSADNTPLRGFKGSLEEGGIRTPFIVSWPGQFSGKRTVDTPVISLDILPTALDAIGVQPPKDPAFDGKSLLPLLTGRSESHHDTLFWCKDGGEWAVRRGDWKLRFAKGSIELFNLVDDPSETTDLAGKQPEAVKAIQSAFDAWIAQMPDPITGGNQRERAKPAAKESTDREIARTKQRIERKKQRDASKIAKRGIGFQPVKNHDAPRQAGNLSHMKPNVLFIVCDDLNTHVSTSGYPHIKTPALDELAAAGLNFGRAYCQYPVCGPSRASFLCGLYPETTRVLDNQSDIRGTRPGTTSLPQLFKEHGYWTAGVGEVFHNPKTNPGDGAWHQFERFDNDENPVEARLRKAFEAKHGSIEAEENRRSWRKIQKDNRSHIAGQTPPGYGPNELRDDQHKDGKNVRQIAEWLDTKANGSKPFFIACGIQKPHVPFWAPREYFDQYPLDALRYRIMPADDWKHRPTLAIAKRYEAFGFEFGKENDRLRREYMQAYHACVSFIDAQIGLLVDSVRRNGHWEDTILILTSDHGYHLGEHYLWGKVTLFEECARVPMIVRVPGRTRAGSQTEGLVETVDIYPTLIDLCNIDVPHKLQGQSFLPLLDDPGGIGKEVAYTVVTRGQLLGRSIRTDRWRYPEWGSPDQAELYDIENDPHEDHNLAADPQYQLQRQTMHRLLTGARQRAEAKSIQ